MQYVNVPDGVTMLEDGVFCSTYLYRLDCSENIKSIGDYALSATHLTELPEFKNLEYIGDYAFCRTPITELPNLENVTHIGSYAFSQTSLVSVDYPSYVPEIGDGLFEGCGNLEEIYIEYFGDILPMSTFDNCSELMRAYISEHQWFWENAFSGCPNLILHIYDDDDGVFEQSFDTPKPYYFVSSLDEEAPIIEENGILYPIEIKKKSEPNKEYIRHFGVLNKFNKPIGKGAVLCLSQTWLPITENVNRIPVHYL